MSIGGIWHFSFTVADIERSISFYRDLLGCELVHRQRQDNEYTRRLVGLSDAVLEIAQFRIPGAAIPVSGHHLELVQYVRPEGNRGDTGINNPGAAHLALVVEDATAEYERLRGCGVTFVSPPNAITAGVNAGGATCYFRDPDAIVLEILQPPAHRLEAFASGG
jgi:catechol 2,3-dioxygenase-like lactoylglutathione lyase family enzyme